MPKPSPMLQKLRAELEAKYNGLFHRKMDMLQQPCVDAAFLAAADVLHMGPGRCEAFGGAMMGYLSEMGRMLYDDLKDDPEFTFTRAKVDARLRQICGDRFDPWEIRYG